MANPYFKFKRFTVWQSLCAMKVGTDGTLLGAWADGGRRILDIGTGTGLIALMMAQRFETSQIVGIDIDEGAARQALENVEASPFARRIAIAQQDVLTLGNEAGLFDSIVCNPPFFVHSLECPDGQRTLARHTASLTYRQLMECAWRLLAEDGRLSVVIPFDCKGRLEGEAALAGFFKSRECAVKTAPHKPPRRYLLAFRKHQVPLEETSITIGSEAYNEMMKDFYL